MNFFYPDNLPIIEHKHEIIDAIVHNQVVVVAGDTGSGKTTQLPKMCLEALPGNDLLIGCTQPRRIAASTVATRVAEELGDQGGLVGYKIRFHDYTTTKTKIKFMTDGVLLAETRNDRDLAQYGVLIVDEAHERSLNIDFLLGYLKQLLRRRPDLKVIITSATIDTKAFSDHFNNAPIITVSGRTYPVSIRYNPLEEDQSGDKESELEHCVRTVCELFAREKKGDILVFLPTERDIRDCCQLLEKKIPKAMVLPIFGRLAAGDQKRIFQTFSQVKIVVATNVAETSITVPGIRYVIDSGLARISYYNVRAKTTSLPVTRISRASCDQRKGRCGRVGPGICIRLYSESDFNDRDEFSLPELKRSNLAEVILQMISLNLGDPEVFPFLEPPSPNAIRDGYRQLKELGAIDHRRLLTRTGRIMADLPIDPAIARIIIEARENNCLREITIISAALAIQDPRTRPADHEKEADLAHKQFAHPHSDFMVLLNLWNTFHNQPDGSKSWSQLKKYCKKYFLSFQRMREWFDLHAQLSRILAKRKGFSENDKDASYEAIHKSFLSGFLRNLARKKQGHLYQGTQNKELMIFPGSQQFNTAGQWLIAASFLETNRLYALTVATIQPEWIEAVAGHLCNYTWSNARWQKRTGQVVADEKATLFGLIISTGRKVNFGKRSKKNVPEAREIFIQRALVHGEINGSFPFLSHNLALIKKWQQAEEKLRMRNIVSDELAIAGFYAEKIPKNVYDRTTLIRFLQQKKSANFLMMEDDDVLIRRPEDNELVNFPPTVALGQMEIRLEYNFLPGSENDGVTFRLPYDFAKTASGDFFEWLVPGLLQEKITFLLKALPKSIRKRLVPISDTVNRLLDDMDVGSGSLYSSLEASILKHFKILIKRSDWSDKLPPHLEPRFQLFDSAGKELCAGRNLKNLIGLKHDNNVQSTDWVLHKADQLIVDRWEGTTHNSWNFKELPDSLPTFTPQGEIAGFLYPVLLEQPTDGCIKIVFVKDKHDAEAKNRRGFLYLYQLQFPEPYKALKKFCTTSLSGPSSVWLMNLGSTRKEVIDRLLTSILVTMFGPISGDLIREEMFISRLEKIKKSGFYAVGQEICQNLMALVRKRRIAEETMRKIFSQDHQIFLYPAEIKSDFQDHLNDIFPLDLLFSNRPIDCQNIDRWLQSFIVRLERFYANPAKDRQKASLLQPYLRKLCELKEKKEQLSTEGLAQLDHYQLLVNEYRIALFSPEIKTSEPVSSQKLDKQWKKAYSAC